MVDIVRTYALRWQQLCLHTSLRSIAQTPAYSFSLLETLVLEFGVKTPRRVVLPSTEPEVGTFLLHLWKIHIVFLGIS